MGRVVGPSHRVLQAREGPLSAPRARPPDHAPGSGAPAELSRHVHIRGNQDRHRPPDRQRRAPGAGPRDRHLKRILASASALLTVARAVATGRWLTAPAVWYTAAVSRWADEALERVAPAGSASARPRSCEQRSISYTTSNRRLGPAPQAEKTHFGTLVEQHQPFEDGLSLDYRIAGAEVDCKYSQRPWGWMIPPEARGGYACAHR